MDLGKVDPSRLETETWLDLGPLAPFQVERTPFETHVRVFWVRCLIWLLVLAIAGWAALAGAACLFVKHQRGFTDVTYGQIFIYPVKPEPYRRAKGEFYLAEGKRLLEEKNYLAAFNATRIGLAQVPEDNEARFFVADVFSAVQRFDLAGETLINGLASNPDSVDYQRRVFAFLFYRHLDDRVVTVAREILDAGERPPAALDLACLALATAHFNRGRYDAARSALTERSLTGSRPGALLAARIFWEQDRRDQALELYARMAERWPDDAEIHTDYTHALRETGRFEQWRLWGVARQLAAPDRITGYIDEMAALAASGQTESLSALEAAAFDRAGDDPKARMALAHYAAREGRAVLAGRLYEHALNRGEGEGWDVAGTAWVEASLEAGDASGALAAVRRILADHPEPEKNAPQLLGGLRSVATYAAGEQAEAVLVLENYLQLPRLRAESLLPIAARLARLDAPALEQRVLARAVELAPLNRDALVRLIEWQLEHGSGDQLYADVSHLLTLRKPPAELLSRIRTRLASDRYLMFEERDRVLTLL